MSRSKNPIVTTVSRRRFMALSGAAGLGLLRGSDRRSAASPAQERATTASGTWGRIEEIGKGVWSVISTPLADNDWTTLCNGGIVAGKERILVIESFARPAGARLVAEHVRELTGRWPTDVLITHYHGDHANGLEGFDDGGERPVVWMTATTRKLIQDADAQRDKPSDPRRETMIGSARLIDPDRALLLDLGGLALEIRPRRGHTASDVTVEIQEQGVIFCGDLVWNQLFPNFRDTLPSALSESVRSLQRQAVSTYVPGHGPLATAVEVARFTALIDAVEAAASEAIDKGIPASEAAAGWRLPEPLGDWHLFRDNYFEVAIGSWYKEMGVDPTG